ncbi:MAG: TolB family protein, partial [bacterium]
MVSRLRFGYYESPAVAPDGALVAYIVRGRRPTLRVTSVVSTATQTINESEKSSWGPSWSPDGRLLAFVSDRDGDSRLWIWSRATGKVRRVSATRVSGVWGWQVPIWTPDGAGILVATASARTPPPPSVARISNDTSQPPRVFRSAASSATARSASSARDTTAGRRQLQDLVEVDVTTGAAKSLVQREPIIRWFLSPDGRTIALVLARGALAAEPTRAVTWLHDVETVDRLSGRRTVAASDMPNTFAVSFSPDSRFIGFFNSDWGPDAHGDCWVAVVGAKARNITPGAHQDFSREDRGPVWDPDGRSVYLESDSAVWRTHIRENGLAGPLTRVFGVPGEALLGLVTIEGSPQPWSPDGGRSLVAITRDVTTKMLRMYTVDAYSGAGTVRY